MANAEPAEPENFEFDGKSYRIEYVSYFPPSRRWYIARLDTYPSIIGPITMVTPAIKESEDFPRGSRYRTRRDARAAWKRFSERARRDSNS